MDSGERSILTEAVRVPQFRENYGPLSALAASIGQGGLRRPITVWRDGTLISGGRRLRAHFLLGLPTIQAVFVHTIEEAAKRMIDDNADDYLALPWKWSEVCRLWETLRRLDAPAAAKRAEANRRRGVELRRQVLAGKRKPGRSHGRSDDYVLGVICEPFGISEASARRIQHVYTVAYGEADVNEETRALAREVLREIDEHGNIWANYKRLVGTRRAPVSRPRPAAALDPASAARQRAAWDRCLPQMEGLVAGLVELGPPNAELTWEQVGPVHARLMFVRRELEKIIKQMRETNRS